MDALRELFSGRHIYAAAPFRGRLPKGIAAVLNAAARYVKHEPDLWHHGCFPAQETIGSDCGRTERSVRSNLAAAERLGLIKRKSQSHGRGNGRASDLILWHPGLLDAALELRARPAGQRKNFVFYLADLAPWGEDTEAVAREVQDLANGLFTIKRRAKISGCKNGKKGDLQPELISGKSPCIHSPPPHGVRAARGAAFRAGAQGAQAVPAVRDVGCSAVSSPPPGGGGAVTDFKGSIPSEPIPADRPFPSESESSGGPAADAKIFFAFSDSMSAGLEADLEIFDQFLRVAAVGDLRVEFQRRKKDGVRGGLFKQRFIRDLQGLRAAIFEAIEAPTKKKSDRIEALCSIKGILIVDDVQLNRVEEYCKETGYRALVVETSPDNYQALFPVSREMSDDDRRATQRALMQHFRQFADIDNGIKGADKNAVALGQLHRLPGSINYKNGSDGQPINFMTRIAAVIPGMVIEKALIPDEPETTESGLSSVFMWAGACRPRQAGQDDQSALDWAAARRAIRAGASEAKAAAVIVARRGGDLRGKSRDYVERTVRKAMLAEGRAV